MKTAMATVVTLSLSAVLLAQSGRPTIPETVRRIAPQPVLSTRQAELVPPSLLEMIPKADLVVRGRIAPSRTYLSPDQRDVFTDYTLTPARVLIQRRAEVSHKPAVTAPIIVKKWGGQMTVEGVPVSFVDVDVPDFAVGEDVFLLLTYDNADGKFTLTGGSGAFTVKNSRIQPRVEHQNYEQYVGMTVAEFERELQQVSR